jgi:hypothetical protein
VGRKTSMNTDNQKVKSLIIDLKENHNLSFREIKNVLRMNGLEMTHVAIWEIYNQYLDRKVRDYLNGGDRA